MYIKLPPYSDSSVTCISYTDPWSITSSISPTPTNLTCPGFHVLAAGVISRGIAPTSTRALPCFFWVDAFFVEGRSLGILDFCILRCKCLLHKPLTGQWVHWSTASRQAGFDWELNIIYRSNAMCAIHMCQCCLVTWSLRQCFSLANLVSVPLKAPCPSAEASQDQFHRFHEIQSFCIKVKLKEQCD